MAANFAGKSALLREHGVPAGRVTVLPADLPKDPSARYRDLGPGHYTKHAIVFTVPPIWSPAFRLAASIQVAD